MSSRSRHSVQTFRLRLSPRAESQLQAFHPALSSCIEARLNRLAARPHRQNGTGQTPIQGHLVGREFRALYEVDVETGTVTVLDVSPRSC